MKTTIKKFKETIAKQLGLNKSKISYSASFDSINADVGRDCSDSMARHYCSSEYNNLGLEIDIYAKKHYLFTFRAKDITPYTNDIRDYMSVGYEIDCIGPGFYQYSPYLYINNECSKENLDKVSETEFELSKARISWTATFKKEAEKEQKELIDKLPHLTLDQNLEQLFFDNLENE